MRRVIDRERSEAPGSERKSPWEPMSPRDPGAGISAQRQWRLYFKLGDPFVDKSIARPKFSFLFLKGLF